MCGERKRKNVLNSREKLLSVSGCTLVMGILNVTPDSFYDGGKYLAVDKACEQAMRLAGEGADIIDIGAESTRPGSDNVDVDTELHRVLPVLERLKGKLQVPVSIDTTRAEVARKALACGAAMVNDISGLRNDPEMVEVVAEHDVPVVIMHMKGTPKDMQEAPFYEDVIGEIKAFLEERIGWAVSRGVKKENIIVDPGIGFGKRLEDNLEILGRLREFREFGRPVLVGPSRKSFIGKILGLDSEDRLWGTAASVAIAAVNGADIVRVHDAGQMRQVVSVADAIVNPVASLCGAKRRGCLGRASSQK